MTDSKPIVGVTMGDPAGIGSEVILKAFEESTQFARVVVIGDADVLRRTRDRCDVDVELDVVSNADDANPSSSSLTVVDLDNVDVVEYGELKREYGEASLEYVEAAISLALDGTIHAIATAPINKQATRLAGSEYAGHTGMLADYTDTEDYSMMLIEDDLRVTHVSTHVPLREACDLVTAENVFRTIEVTNTALQDLGIESPTIAVAGLNPHASDGGLLGDEEREEIEPAVQRARTNGMTVHGPESPDTVYVQAASGEYDCVVSMYHDEGHIPVKMLGFQQSGDVSGVNMTIGLPIVRTSVDHGTAFDIAGDGIASARSMIDAIEVATSVSR